MYMQKLDAFPKCRKIFAIPKICRKGLTYVKDMRTYIQNSAKSVNGLQSFGAMIHDTEIKNTLTFWRQEINSIFVTNESQSKLILN